MENINKNIDAEDQHNYLSWHKGHRRGKIIGGIVVVLFGILFLLKEANVPIHEDVFSWQTILISIGVIVLAKHKFKKMSGYVLILLGTLFLFREWYPDMINLKFIWPVLIILFGLAMIFKKHTPGRFKNRDFKNFREKRNYMARFEDLESISPDDFIDSVSVFSGIKKNVVSKNFKGADVVTIFGGSEINLLQADFVDKAIIDVTCVFGGMTLTIPANWQVKSELTCIFGGIEDKSNKEIPHSEPGDKILILRGSCFFGGIEINNFA